MLMAVEIMLNAAGLAFSWREPLGTGGRASHVYFHPRRSRRRRCRSDWRSCCGFIVNSHRLTLMRGLQNVGLMMLELLWLVPALPLFGFWHIGRRRRMVSRVGHLP